jgi:glycosyltransferase involved in cell wall biosynthesis
MVDLRRWPLHINKYLFQFLAAWTAWRLHRRYRFDAAWAMMAHSGGIPAYLFTRLVPTVPLVLELQEGDAPSYIERIMRPVWPLFTRVFTRADAVSVISTFLGRWAVQRGFPGTPVLVPNGVDVANFARVYPDAVLDTMRDALGKRMGDVFLVTTSRLVRKNACDDVIRALAMLPEHLSFVILGNGPEEVALKKLASSLDVVERVWFVGHIGHTDMPKYLKACDIFVRPSRSEGMGASFVEAMAAGLPVIATQEGGIADFLFDEKRNPDKPITGWAVEKDSPEDIARAVRDIMDKPEKVRAVVRTAKEMVIEQYDWDVVTKTMREQVFEPLFR